MNKKKLLKTIYEKVYDVDEYGFPRNKNESEEMEYDAEINAKYKEIQELFNSDLYKMKNMYNSGVFRKTRKIVFDLLEKFIIVCVFYVVASKSDSIILYIVTAILFLLMINPLEVKILNMLLKSKKILSKRTKIVANIGIFSLALLIFVILSISFEGLLKNYFSNNVTHPNSILIMKSDIDTTYKFYNTKNELLLEFNKRNTDSSSLESIDYIYKVSREIKE